MNPQLMANRVAARVKKFSKTFFGNGVYKTFTKGLKDSIAIDPSWGPEIVVNIAGGISGRVNAYGIKAQNSYTAYPRILRLIDRFPLVRTKYGKILGRQMFKLSSEQIAKVIQWVSVEDIKFTMSELKSDPNLRILVDNMFHLFHLAQMVDNIPSNVKHLSRQYVDDVFTLCGHAAFSRIPNYTLSKNFGVQYQLIDGITGTWTMRCGLLNPDTEKVSDLNTMFEAKLSSTINKTSKNHGVVFEYVKPGMGLMTNRSDSLVQYSTSVFYGFCALALMVNAQSSGESLFDTLSKKEHNWREVIA